MDSDKVGINPKDLIGAKKVDLSLFPPVAHIYGALGMMNGAGKYGPYNWRDPSKKIQMMIYLSALQRHISALIDGEDIAQDSKLPHLAHIIAGAGILADATEGGWVIDNRPPKGQAAEVLEKFNTSGNSPKEKGRGHVGASGQVCHCPKGSGCDTQAKNHVEILQELASRIKKPDFKSPTPNWDLLRPIFDQPIVHPSLPRMPKVFREDYFGDSPNSGGQGSL